MRAFKRVENESEENEVEAGKMGRRELRVGGGDVSCGWHAVEGF